MTSNVWAVAALFLAGVGALLSATAATLALRGLRPGSARGQGELEEDRAHLLGLVVAVLLGARFLAWPLFYFLLKSLVPELAPFGVMCTFGVTRIQPGLVLALQWIKPLSLAALAYWCLLMLVDRRAAAPLLRGSRFVLAVPLAALVAAECALEVVYVTSEKAGLPITCCSQFSEVGPPPARFLLATPTARPAAVWTTYALTTLAVAVAAALLARHVRRKGPNRPGAVGIALLAPAGLAVAGGAWHAVVAPRVLELPYHHCVYELVTDLPVMGLAAGLTVGGFAALLWPLGLEPWCKRAPEAVAEVQGDACSMAALALVSGLFIVAVHSA